MSTRKVLWNILVICACTLNLSCSNQPLDPEGNEGFLDTAFDGDWTWYEDGEALYHLTITNGELSGLDPAMAHARRIAYAQTNCDTDRRHGLVALAWHNDETDENGVAWRVSTTFRFDQPDASAERCRLSLEEGTFEGMRIVSKVDHDDVFLLPDIEQASGQLVRRTEK